MKQTISQLLKSATLILATIALLSPIWCQAQDAKDLAPAPQPNPYKQLAIDLGKIIRPILPATNATYVLSLGYGQNTKTHEGIIAGMLSIVNTNETGISIIGGRIGSEWKYGGGAFSIGRTDTLPVIGAIVGKTTESIGDGVIYDWKTHDPANYVFTRFSKDILIKKLNIGIGVMVANRSNESGVDVIIGAHGGFTF